MYIIVINATQKMIGPFKSEEEAKLYIKTEFNFLPDDASSIVRLSEP